MVLNNILMVICENVIESYMAFVLECTFSNSTLQEFPKSKIHKEFCQNGHLPGKDLNWVFPQCKPRTLLLYKPG